MRHFRYWRSGMAPTQELGYLLAAATLPFLVLGLFGGVAADRLPRRDVLIACDVLRVAITIAFVGMVTANVTYVGLLYVFAFVPPS